LAIYLTAVGACLILQIVVLQLWKADLTVPFDYHGDGIWTQTWVKGIIEYGWYLHNDSLGAPFGQDMHDFPMADGLHFLVLAAIARITGDSGLTVNLYYLLTFPLTTLTTLCVLRRFQVSPGSAVAASLLFAFAPYHFMRGPGHLFLAAYFLLPLLVQIILEVYLDRGPLLFPEAESGRLYWRLGRSFCFSAVICLLVGSAGVYYAFFGCWFLLVAAAASALRHRDHRPLLAAGVLVALIAGGVAINVAPCLLPSWYQGANPAALVRPASSVEQYSLKIAQLILPITGHRLPILADLKNYYNQAPLVTENDTASLGFIGTVGLLFLLARLLTLVGGEREPGLLDGLSLLTVSSVLLATIGGLGSVLCLLLPLIRCYNRISIYIALFALFAVAILLDWLERHTREGFARLGWYGVLALLLTLGIWDQTCRRYVPRYAATAASYHNDAEFVRRVEDALPAGARVFQLPYMDFPEPGGPCAQMQPYSHLRGYLHSRQLRWSYGVFRGRPGHDWQRETARRRADEMVRELVAVGFHGIYLDRAGYPDQGSTMVSELTELLGTPPLVSKDGRLLVFPLPGGND
jgi:phosphoglycerol transferase